MSQWQALGERAAGKWQLPVLLLSLLLLPVAFLRLHPPPTLIPLDEAIRRLETLVSGGYFEQAITLGDIVLLRKDEGVSDAELAPVHMHLARARYGDARGVRAKRPDVGRQVNEHFGQAIAFGLPLVAKDYLSMARGLEWQGKHRQAIERYREALSHGIEEPFELRRHIISLTLTEELLPDEEVAGLLDAYLADVGVDRLDLRLWAIEKRLELLAQENRLEEAATLLGRDRDRFVGTDLNDRFAYLEAWLLFKTGHFDEAETHLRSVRNQEDLDDDVDAMTGWLLGRVVLDDGTPQRPLEALSFFDDVINRHPTHPFAAACRVGQGEALAVLERHDEALNAFRFAVEDVDAHKGQTPVDREVLRTSLGMTSETQRQAGRFREAVEYARLAVELLDPANTELVAVYLQQLGRVQVMLAEDLEAGAVTVGRTGLELTEAKTVEARAAFADAAATYRRLMQMRALNDEQASAASWSVAEYLARAGKRSEAARLYTKFASDWPQDPLAPRALLRVGQLHQASGQLPEAVEAYRECYRRFPRLLDSSRALVPLARCYLSMGSQYEELAERTLQIVLQDSQVFTPEAPEFADAMFLFGDVLNRQGDHERAIATLEEALERYPDDPRGWHARYALADAYRQSGLGLKAETVNAKFAEEMLQMRAESNVRFTAAGRLFRRLIMEFESGSATDATRLEEVYLRHAYLYEADCLFELQDYRQALKLYEQAAGLYKDTPSALAAYVQIINSHVFLGQPEEARAALARALVLVEAVPQKAFERVVASEGRADWQRYFEWLGQSELF